MTSFDFSLDRDTSPRVSDHGHGDLSANTDSNDHISQCHNYSEIPPQPPAMDCLQFNQCASQDSTEGVGFDLNMILPYLNRLIKTAVPAVMPENTCQLFNNDNEEYKSVDGVLDLSCPKTQQEPKFNEVKNSTDANFSQSSRSLLVTSEKRRRISKEKLQISASSYSGSSSESKCKQSSRSYDQKKEQKFECEMCPAVFIRKGDYNRHELIHTGEKPHKCEVCHAKFRQKGHLNEHMVLHTDDKPYTCHICGTKFGRRWYLNVHKRIHTGEKPFECNFCHLKFTHKSGLASHVRLHTGKQQFKCDVCGVVFNQSSSLNSHMELHNQATSYQCQFCGENFALKAYLTDHLIIHGEKPHQCTLCHKKFEQRSSLNAHMRVHTGEKPYKCDYCDAAFTSKGNLSVHSKNFHFAQTGFNCETCHKSFPNEFIVEHHDCVPVT